MSKRAKFVCTQVSKQVSWNGKSYQYAATFYPVVSGNEENEQFFESTPTGKIELSTIREDYFIPGKSYYIDFTEAAK